ncbi:MAG: TonB-dependent receptor [Novosphingobium sp.]
MHRGSGAGGVCWPAMPASILPGPILLASAALLLPLSNAAIAKSVKGDEEIIVAGIGEQRLLLDARSETGSRLRLSVRETPAIVDILSQELMQERGLRTSIEVLNAVPGATAGELASSPGQMSMRGFTSGAISLLYDGIRQTTSSLIVRNLDSWSFDRIEVLKGPAGVLYGEGSLAGAVNLIPKKPRFDSEAYALMAAYGSFDALRVGADANILLSERVAIRGVSSLHRTSGFIDDTDARFFAATLAATFKPTEKLTVELAADYFGDEYGTAYWGTPLVPLTAARRPSGLVTTVAGYGIDKALRKKNYNVTNADQGSDARWLRSRFAYEISDRLTFTNELSYYDADRRFHNAEIYTYAGPSTAFPNGSFERRVTRIDHDHQFVMERATLTGETQIAGRRNRLSAGIEYSRSDFASGRQFGSTSPVDLHASHRGALAAPDDIAARSSEAVERANFDSRTTITSLFAEEAFNVTPGLLLVGGIRYDHIRLERIVDDLGTGTRTAFSRSWNPISWRAGMVYDLAPRTQIFGQYSYAVAPVGNMALISAANAKFDLTTGRSVEGGIKASLYDGRLDLTAAGYWIQRDGIVTRDPENSSIAVQGGSQSSRGIELSASATITKRFRLDVSLAVLDARFDTLIDAGGANRAGNIPPVVPERVASVFGIYRIEGAPITLSGGARYASHFFTDSANSIRVRGATVLDAAISYRLPFGDITLRGRNLTDRFHANWSGGAARQITLSAPRSVEIGFSARFQP